MRTLQYIIQKQEIGSYKQVDILISKNQALQILCDVV